MGVAVHIGRDGLGHRHLQQVGGNDVQSYVPNVALGRGNRSAVDARRAQTGFHPPDENEAAFALIALDADARDTLCRFGGVRIGEPSYLVGRDDVLDVDSVFLLIERSGLSFEKRFRNGYGLVVLGRRPELDVLPDRLPGHDLHLYRCRVEAQIRNQECLPSRRGAIDAKGACNIRRSDERGSLHLDQGTRQSLGGSETVYAPRDAARVGLCCQQAATGEPGQNGRRTYAASSSEKVRHHRSPVRTPSLRDVSVERQISGDDGMDMGVPLERRAECLDDCDHSRSGVGLVDGGGHHLADGFVGE